MYYFPYLLYKNYQALPFALPSIEVSTRVAELLGCVLYVLIFNTIVFVILTLLVVSSFVDKKRVLKLLKS